MNNGMAFKESAQYLLSVFRPVGLMALQLPAVCPVSAALSPDGKQTARQTKNSSAAASFTLIFGHQLYYYHFFFILNIILIIYF